MSTNIISNLNRLPNELYKQYFTLPDSTTKVIYLDFQPKAGTLVIQKIISETETYTYTRSTTTSPAIGEVYFQVRTGEGADANSDSARLIFNANEPRTDASGTEYQLLASYLPGIPSLYNLNESRTRVYEQLFQIPTDTYKVYLDHIPKAGTLSVQRIVSSTETIVYTIVNNAEPNPGEVYFEYRDEYDYIAAKGVLLFNEEDAKLGSTFYARYIPVASRIDATVINTLIDHYNAYDDNVWTRTDLAQPRAEDIIAWNAIKDRPVLVTATKDGLMSKDDKSKLDVYPDFSGGSTKLIGSLVISQKDVSGSNEYYPSTIGGPINIETDDVLSLAKKETNSISAGINLTTLRSKFGLTADITAALAGTEGLPSDTNRYVTNDDYKVVKENQQTYYTKFTTDIADLQTQINNKVDVSYKYDITEIKNYDKVQGPKGDKGDTIQLEWEPIVTEPAKTDAYHEIDYSTENVHKITLHIPRGESGGTVAYDTLTEEQIESLRGLSGYPAGLIVPTENVHTGNPGTNVIFTVSDPYNAEIGGKVYSVVKATNITIPKGAQGTRGISSYVKLGAVSTTDNNKDAVITPHYPESTTRIEGVDYYVTTFDFELPRGPKGAAKSTKIEFSSVTETGKYSDWSDIDEDENYTLTIPVKGSWPTTRAFELIDAETALYEEALATVRFDYDHVYIIADHKFKGFICLEGVEETQSAS